MTARRHTKNTKGDTKGTKSTKGTKGFRSTHVAFVAVVLIFVSLVSAFTQPRRIISLVPAVTEMLFAIGAGPQVVAVSSYDEDPAEVRSLPRVGALIDPDVERIFALKPSLVVTYGSQDDLKQQLARATIPVFDYRHAGLADITSTLRRLGEATGHPESAERTAATIERQIDAIRAETRSRPRPRTLLVFGRERGTLRNIYVSGGRGFLHDMLDAAGGVNVFADIPREAVQASTELILTRAPEVILEVRSADIMTADEAAQEARAWAPLASVPAVRQRRVIVLTGRGLTVPGPRVADVVRQMADALR